MFNFTDVRLKSMKWTPWGLVAAVDSIRHLIVPDETMLTTSLRHLAPQYRGINALNDIS